MNGETHGRIEAITLVLTAVMSRLPPAMAADVAVSLAEAHVDAAMNDTEDVPQLQIESRDELVRAWLDLLRAVARQR